MPNVMNSEAQNRMPPQMEIRISGISDGDHPFEFEVSPEAIGLEGFTGSVKATGELRKSAHQFFLTGRVTGAFSAECDRCLADVNTTVDVPISIYFISSADDHVAGDDEFEVRVISPEEHRIVIDEEVRQALAVQVPIKILCSEACRGLCPKCGQDLNQGDCNCDVQEIDPRWGKLAELFKDKPDDASRN